MTLPTAYPSVPAAVPGGSPLPGAAGRVGRPALFPMTAALPPRTAAAAARDVGRHPADTPRSGPALADPLATTGRAAPSAPVAQDRRLPSVPARRTGRSVSGPVLTLVPDPRSPGPGRSPDASLAPAASQPPAAVPAPPAGPPGRAAAPRLVRSSRPVPSDARRATRRTSSGEVVDRAEVPQAVRDLLADAGRGLGRAIGESVPAERYAAAHLAALRAAAAVLAARARPVRGRRGSAWELMTRVAPGLGEWAAFFAAGSAKRRAAEAGVPTSISPREADDMIRQVAVFLELAERAVQRG